MSGPHQGFGATALSRTGNPQDMLSGGRQHAAVAAVHFYARLRTDAAAALALRRRVRLAGPKLLLPCACSCLSARASACTSSTSSFLSACSRLPLNAMTGTASPVPHASSKSAGWRVLTPQHSHALAPPACLAVKHAAARRASNASGRCTHAQHPAHVLATR